MPGLNTDKWNSQLLRFRTDLEATRIT